MEKCISKYGKTFSGLLYVVLTFLIFFFLSQHLSNVFEVHSIHLGCILKVAYGNLSRQYLLTLD